MFLETKNLSIHVMWLLGILNSRWVGGGAGPLDEALVWGLGGARFGLHWVWAGGGGRIIGMKGLGVRNAGERGLFVLKGGRGLAGAAEGGVELPGNIHKHMEWGGGGFAK